MKLKKVTGGKSSDMMLALYLACSCSSTHRLQFFVNHSRGQSMHLKIHFLLRLGGHKINTYYINFPSVHQSCVTIIYIFHNQFCTVSTYVTTTG